MPTLYIVGAGLFGSPAAAWARRRGIEAVVFDAGLPGAASPAAAGLFSEALAGRKHRDTFAYALPLLEQLYGVRHVRLACDDGGTEERLCVPPGAVLERQPRRERVTAVGDGWLEADGQRYEGWVYLAAGVWCAAFLPELGVYGKAGTAFTFAGERLGRMRALGSGRQALAFVRDAGTTYFSDGTAERDHTDGHERATLTRAAEMGLCEEPLERHHGVRPYAAGGPIFRRIGERTWVGTGGRKMGTVLGAAYARRLVEEELQTANRLR